MAKKYYGIRKGNKVGVFDNWADAQKSISGYSGAEYKGFTSKEDAEEFVYGETKVKVKNEINIDSKDTVCLYIDGSFMNDKVGFGIVAVKEEDALFRDAGKYPGSDTSLRNVAGEIYATIRAIQLSKANDFKHICICYDYQGIEAWINGTWSAKTDLTRRYVEYFNKHTAGMNVTFKKVQAHSGDKWNEIADEMAKLGTTL